eukprot:c9260_g1_i1 orf=2-499(-)
MFLGAMELHLYSKHNSLISFLVVLSLGLAQFILLSSVTMHSFAKATLLQGKHEVYVVYLGHHGDLHKDVIVEKHHELLRSVKGSHEGAANSMLYSYKHGFSGFSARLTAEEAAALSRKGEVVSVFPSQQRKLHTTRSWEFLGVQDTQTFGANLFNPSNVSAAAAAA